MKKIISIMLLLSMQTAFAALSPKHQNMNDLNVMVSFVKKHDRVISSLKSIDLRRKVVHFGNGCQAIFERKRIRIRPGSVGPAAPLVFVHATCDIYWH
ncbi:MAG: hypothetical protein U9R27_06565 [Campylobacterota bacterium]|nr:hypothetical protein [Campylobacterota bacterium]